MRFERTNSKLSKLAVMHGDQEVRSSLRSEKFFCVSPILFLDFFELNSFIDELKHP
jgi:hypothetical protein